MTNFQPSRGFNFVVCFIFFFLYTTKIRYFEHFDMLRGNFFSPQMLVHLYLSLSLGISLVIKLINFSPLCFFLESYFVSYNFEDFVVGWSNREHGQSFIYPSFKEYSDNVAWCFNMNKFVKKSKS